MPQLFTNNARALLASGITDSATSLTVEASKADLFPTANVDSGSVPSANNWFKVTLQDEAGNVEIVYVRTRTAGSGIMSNLMRGQEGTTARAFSAGTVVGLRITAADVEDSIAAAANSVQLSGNQTIGGTKTFSNQIVASGGVQGNVTGNVTGDVSGNAGTVTNGVYTTGDQTIGGAKTFTSPIVASGGVQGNAATVTNGVYTTGDQTIGGVKTFSSPIAGSITGNAATATTADTANAVSDGAVGAAALQPPAAGDTHVLWSQNSTVAADATTYTPPGHNRYFSAGAHVGVLCLVPGTIRCRLEHRTTNSAVQSFARILRNGTQLVEWSTTSTAFVARTLDVQVALGDQVIFQHRRVDTNVAEWRNLRVSSANPNMAVA